MRSVLCILVLAASAAAEGFQNEEFGASASARTGHKEYEKQEVTSKYGTARAEARVTSKKPVVKSTRPKKSTYPHPPIEVSVEPEYSPVPYPKEPTGPSFPVDFDTTEASLRTSIFQADVEGAATVLRSSRVISLGAGLTYPDELSPLVEPSQDRNKDPDVVAFKALAKSALETHEAYKLATAVVLSFQPSCQCSAVTSEEADELREAFAQDFKNRKELFEIVTADANKVNISARGQGRGEGVFSGSRSFWKELDGGW